MKKHGYIRIAVTSIAAGLLFLVEFLFIHSSQEIFSRQAQYTLQNIAREKSDSIEYLINYSKSSIQLISNFVSQQMTEKELKNQQEIFSKYSNQIPFNYLEYVRWDGLNLASGQKNEVPFDASNRGYYKNGIKGITGIWPNFKPKFADEILVNFYTPLYYQNEIVGVITGALGEESEIRPHLSASFFGHQTATFIFNENYTVISSTTDELKPEINLWDYSDDEFVSDLLWHAKDKIYTPFEYIINNKKGLCCISEIENTNWHVGIIVFPTVLAATEKEIIGRQVYISIFIIIILLTYFLITFLLQSEANKIINTGLVNMANKDELTGILNRRAFEEELKRLRQEGLDENFVNISMDVNGLKKVNDTFGHEAGDELIQGAAKCIEKVFEPYGTVYRTGGDEFQALIYTDQWELEELKAQLERHTMNWKGKYTEDLRISSGYVSKVDNRTLSVDDIIKLADQRMYKNKSLFYTSNGIDRRAHSVAFEVICKTYKKILQINLKEDTFSIINMSSEDYSPSKGYNERISKWLYDFAFSGQVHPEDLQYYLRKTDIEYLREYFTSGNTSLFIKYRRLVEEEFHNSYMEIIASKDFSYENQSVYLYVKDLGLD